ncbi:hypothetical protein BH09MYX1_BH09MYX1_25260 [soil metagenome]
MRRAVGLVVVTLAVLGGCLLPDLGSYSGTVASPNDASAPETSDAVADAVVPNGDGSDAPSAHFCDGNLTAFCADFDETELLAASIDGKPGKWTTAFTDPTGSLTLDSSRAISAPAALFAQLPRRGDVNQLPREQLRWAVSDAWRRVRITMQMYLENPGWMQGDINAALLEWACYSKGGDTGVVMTLGDGYVSTGETSATPINGNGFPLDTWTSVVLDFDPAGSMRLDYGSLFINQTFVAKVKAGQTSCFLSVGIDGFNDPAPPFRVHYDDVTLAYVQ